MFGRQLNLPAIEAKIRKNCGQIREELQSLNSVNNTLTIKNDYAKWQWHNFRINQLRFNSPSLGISLEKEFSSMFYWVPSKAGDLYKACYHNHLNVVDYILEKNKNDLNKSVQIAPWVPAVSSEIRCTPLDIAVKRNHFEVAKKLLAHGASVSITSSTDPKMQTLLDLFKYREDLFEECNSLSYQATKYIRQQYSIWKKNPFYDKEKKLKAVNWLIEKLSSQNQAEPDQEIALYLQDGRLKEVYSKFQNNLSCSPGMSIS